MEEHNLNPGDVIFVDMLVGKNITKSFPDSFETKYHITYQELMERALGNEWIVHSYMKSAAKFKVTKLKTILKGHKINITGKKAELINRLVNGLPDEELEKLFGEKSFLITTEGKKILKKYDFVFTYFQNEVIAKHISLDDYFELCVENPDLSWNQALINYFTETAELNLRLKNWNSYREVLSVLLDITGEIKYKCQICFVELNFLTSLSEAGLPEPEEIDEFKKQFVVETKIYSEYKTDHSAKETLSMILAIINNEVKNVGHEAFEAEMNSRIPEINVEMNMEATVPQEAEREHIMSLDFDTDKKRNTKPLSIMIFGAIGLVVLIYFYLKF